MVLNKATGGAKVKKNTDSNLEKKDAITTEDLVVLKYADNECYVQVVSVDDAKAKYKNGFFSVDLEKLTWKYGSREFKIGRMRHCERGSRGGVIGVYNRLSLDQLNSMAHAATEAVQTDHIWSAD